MKKGKKIEERNKGETKMRDNEGRE